MKRHDFVGVFGHPDDDECTYRPDGTDATYCGDSAADPVHELTGGLCDYDRSGWMCTRTYDHTGEHILVPETPAAVAPGWSGDYEGAARG